ncbi:MAG: hypothetical protein ACPGJS_08270 [Flammeovirgaceae bacterium]
MGVHYSHLNQAAHCIYELLQNGEALDLPFNDVYSILSYERDYYEQLSFSAIPEDSSKIIQFVRLNAGIDGKEFSANQIQEVLKAEEEYLRELGMTFFDSQHYS